MKITITQIPLFAKEQVTEETFEINRSIVDALDCILVVSPDEGIAEVPRMFCKQVILHIEAYRPQILDDEDGNGTGVAFSISMDLPDSRRETSDMGDEVILDGCIRRIRYKAVCRSFLC